MTINKPKQQNIKGANPSRHKERGPKKPRRITESYLHNSGLYYLQRYAASSEHFRSVMLRKVKRSCAYHQDQNYEQCAAMVDALVKKFKESMLLDDESYIRAMVASLRRKGVSERTLIEKMKMKGVDRDETRKYLQHHDSTFAGEHCSADLKAAVIFARRKKLGPFGNHTDEEKPKILAKFGRAGFAYDIAKTILEMQSEEAENILYETL